MHLDALRFRLVQAATTYDRRQVGKRSHNPYALPQYLARIDDILADIRAGASPRDAVVAGFTGPLQTACLRAIAESAGSPEEKSGAGRLTYTPVSNPQPPNP